MQNKYHNHFKNLEEGDTFGNRSESGFKLNLRGAGKPQSHEAAVHTPVILGHDLVLKLSIFLHCLILTKYICRSPVKTNCRFLTI